VFQPINVKLEVHPNNGAPYIVMDRFNAKREAYYTIQPGVEMQVAIARFDATWVASLPETAVAIQQQRRAEHIHPAVAENTEAQLGRLKHMLDTGLITQQDFDQKKAQILARM